MSNDETKDLRPKISGPGPAVIARIEAISRHLKESKKKHLIWEDNLLDFYAGQSYKVLDEDILDRIGASWFKTLLTGRIYAFNNYTPLLALHLKNPKDYSVICSPESQISIQPQHTSWIRFSQSTEVSVLESSVAETSTYSVESAAEWQPENISEKNAQHNFPSKRLVGEALPGIQTWKTVDAQTRSHSSIEKVLKGWNRELRIAYYCFMAAVACRVITKTPSTLQRHLQKASADKFHKFYKINGVLPPLPSPSIQALEFLVSTLRPGEPCAIALMKGFLKAAKGSDRIDRSVQELLNYTLLIHTSFNGMGLISLSYSAVDSLGFTDLEELFKNFWCEDTKDGIIAVQDYVETYSKAPNAKLGEYAPWCRIINDQYWCNLALKEHSILAHLLVAACEKDNGEIWKTKSFRVEEFIKVKAQSVIKFHRESTKLQK